MGCSSKHRKTVSLHTWEAEYLVASHALHETLSIDRLYTIIPELKASSAISFHHDNNSAILEAKSKSTKRKQKHIQTQKLHIKHYTNTESINIQHVASPENHTDCLKKQLIPVHDAQDLVQNQIWHIADIMAVANMYRIKGSAKEPRSIMIRNIHGYSNQPKSHALNGNAQQFL